MTISSGMMSSSFDVNIIDNAEQDSNKMFSITIRLISTCLPINIKSDTSSVTIRDDEGIILLFYCVTLWWCQTNYMKPNKYSLFVAMSGCTIAHALDNLIKGNLKSKLYVKAVLFRETLRL